MWEYLDPTETWTKLIVLHTLNSDTSKLRVKVLQDVESETKKTLW